MRDEHALDPREIEACEVVFPRFEYVNRPHPETGLDGKFSVQYTTAVALLDGEVTVDSFTNERRFAPDVAALLPRVELIVDDSIPNDFDRMHVVVTRHDEERRASFEDASTSSRGWIGQPLTREQRMKNSTPARAGCSIAPRPSASWSSSRTWMSSRRAGASWTSSRDAMKPCRRQMHAHEHRIVPGTSPASGW